MRLHGLALVALVVCAAAVAYADSNGAAFFDKLKAIDDKYCSSLTLSGTRVNTLVPDGSTPPTEQDWWFSVEGNRWAIHEVVTGVLKWEDVLRPGEAAPPPGRGSRTNTQIAIYFDSSESVMLMYVAPQSLPAGPVKRGTLRDVAPANCGSVNIESPELGGYKYQVNEVLWSAGRGFSSEIREVTSVSTRPDGMLDVTARGETGRLGTKTLELVVDPSAAYMVRSAKIYHPSVPGRPWVEVSNEGTNWNGDCCYPSKSSMVEIGGTETPIRGTRKFAAGSFGGDGEFMDSVKAAVAGPFPVPVDVIDRRSDPPVITSYKGPLDGLDTPTLQRKMRRVANEIDRGAAAADLSASAPAHESVAAAAESTASAPAPKPATGRWWIGLVILAAAVVTAACGVLVTRMRRRHAR